METGRLGVEVEEWIVEIDHYLVGLRGYSFGREIENWTEIQTLRVWKGNVTSENRRIEKIKVDRGRIDS